MLKLLHFCNKISTVYVYNTPNGGVFMKKSLRAVFIFTILITFVLISTMFIYNKNKVVAQAIDVQSIIVLYFDENPINKEINDKKIVKSQILASKAQKIAINEYNVKLQESKFDEAAKSNESKIDNKNDKVAYLTFDDGPSSVNTMKILEILDEYDVKATFFVLGSMSEKNPEVLLTIHDKGHSIGNHGYSHNYKKIYDNSDSFFKDIDRGENVLKDILGEEFNTKLLRFPGGSFGKKKSPMKELSKQKGYNVVDWNVVIGDAEKKNPSKEYLINRFMETHKNKKNIIILMHDTDAKNSTVEVLPQIIDILLFEGYTIKTLDEE